MLIPTTSKLTYFVTHPKYCDLNNYRRLSANMKSELGRKSVVIMTFLSKRIAQIQLILNIRFSN